MAQRSIRFGVGNIESLHAATWKLWTETSGGNSEIYLACRELGGELKVSMHQSGKWHVAFSSGFFKQKVEGAIPSLNSRFTDMWFRPPEIANGVTLAFRIITPKLAISSKSDIKNPNKIKWVPPPPEAKAVEIYILITTPNAKFSEWPGKDSMSTDFLASFQLNNGNTVWAVWLIIDNPYFTNLAKGKGEFFRDKSEADISGADNLRALVFCDNSDGSKSICDLGVKYTES